MEIQDHISIEIFCLQYGVEVPFVSALEEHGLIEIRRVSEERYIALEQLGAVEKMIRLNRDLQVNVEGIDVIINLLERIKDMQGRISGLTNRLRLYEGE